MPVQLAAAQFAPRKADYVHNLGRIGEVFAQVDQMDPRPDVLALPETVLSGYFLQGGVREVARSRQNLFADLLAAYRANTRTPDALLDVAVGFYELHEGAYYNAAMYATLAGEGRADEARIVHVHHKFFLPTYGVFDEKRYVARGRSIDAFDTRFGRSALLICEDAWHSLPSAIAALKGAHLLYVLSASPGREFGGGEAGNLTRWKRLLPTLAEEHSIFLVYAGLVGFEGGKGFTGSSCVIDPWGRTLVEAPVLEEALVTARVVRDDVAIARAGSPLLADLEAAVGDLALELEAIARGDAGARR